MQDRAEAPTDDCTIDFKQTIIYAPRVQRQNVLIERAKRGINSVNISFMGTRELAKCLSIASGFFPNKKIINQTQQLHYIASAIKNIDYFNCSKVQMTLKDIEAVANALNLARKCVREFEDEFEHKIEHKIERAGLKRGLAAGEFKEKNDALLQVYDNYMNQCERDDVIDEITWVRLVLRNCNSGLDAHVKCFDASTLTPLEAQLFEKCAQIDNALENQIGISEIYCADAGENNNNNFNNSSNKNNKGQITYKKCYGQANEVASLIDEIFSKDIPLDEAVICVSNPASYIPLILDIAFEYNIPVTFGTGIPIARSHISQLLELYLVWCVVDNFSYQSLKGMLQSDAFDINEFLSRACATADDNQANFKEGEFLERLYSARFTNNEHINQERIKHYRQSINATTYTPVAQGGIYVDALEEASRLLSLPVSDFLRTFSRYRKYATYSKEEVQPARLKEAPNSTDEENSTLQLNSEHKSHAQAETKLSETISAQMSAEFEKSAQMYITKKLNEYEAFSNFVTFKDYAQHILGAWVSAKSSQAQALHICDISQVAFMLRKHVFIAGLSSRLYPGSARENYLLLDNDILNLCESGSNKNSICESDLPSNNVSESRATHTSFGQVKHKSQLLCNIVSSASKMGCDVHLSYPHFDAVELKANNPSSVLFEIFRSNSATSNASMDAFERAFENVGYFDPQLSRSREVGSAYTKALPVVLRALENDAQSQATSTNEFSVAMDVARGYSPSRLDKFFSCPRHYFLECELGLVADDDHDNMDVLSASEFGKLVHWAMEELGRKKQLSLQEFIFCAHKTLDAILSQSPPLVDGSVAALKQELEDVLTHAYNQDPACEIVSCESDVGAMHESSGVRVHGIPDRVEVDADGNLVVVDFKTGRKISHVENDVITCFQTMLYAYILEANEEFRTKNQANISLDENCAENFEQSSTENCAKNCTQDTPKHAVSRGEYRYVRYGKTVTCEYTDSVQEVLDRILKSFRYALESGTFDIPVNNKGEVDYENNGCKYCKMGDICTL